MYLRERFSDIMINMKDVNVQCKYYNNLRYSGDTALLAANEKELSESKRKRSGKIIWTEMSYQEDQGNGCQ